MLKRKTILAVTIIFLLLAVGCSVSKEDTKIKQLEGKRGRLCASPFCVRVRRSLLRHFCVCASLLFL